ELRHGGRPLRRGVDGQRRADPDVREAAPVGVPASMLQRLRGLCLALPQAHEEAAWTGTRWRIRTHTFPPLPATQPSWPPAYARAAGTAGPACVMTLRSPLPEADAFAFGWAPFFKPGWWPDIVGMTLDARTDWEEVAALITESYCRLAPKKLAATLRAAG